MLRIAVPNKGSLSEPAVEMLREAGYRTRRDTKELVLTDTDNEVEFFYLRPRDIAVYVGEGTLDVGLTGRDLVLDSRAPVEERLTLGFGESTFRFAAPDGRFAAPEDLDGARVATSYAGVLEDWFKARAVNAKVIRLDGAVESAVRLGVADAIADQPRFALTEREAVELKGLPGTHPLWRVERAARR